MSWRKVTLKARAPRFRLTVESLDRTPPPLRLETFPWQSLQKSIMDRGSFRSIFARAAVLEWLQGRSPQEAAEVFILWTFHIRRSQPQMKTLAADLAAHIVANPRKTLAASSPKLERSVWGTWSMLALLFPDRFDPPPPLHHARLQLEARSVGEVLVTRRDYPFVRTTFVANLLSEADPASQLALQLAPKKISPAFLLWYVEIGRWAGRPASARVDVYSPARWLAHLRRGQAFDLRTTVNERFD